MSPLGVLLPAILLFQSSSLPASLGKISIGSKEADVLRVMGSPRRQKNGDGFIRKTYNYRLTSVEFDEDGLVAGIVTRDRTQCYDHSVCPGQTLSQVLGKYKMERAPNKKGYSSVYTLAGDGCSIEFNIKVKTVDSIEIFCPP